MVEKSSHRCLQSDRRRADDRFGMRAAQSSHGKTPWLLSGRLFAYDFAIKSCLSPKTHHFKFGITDSPYAFINAS